MNIGGGDSGNSQDFEINLAPIVDCFTVLIAFMIISASYISIGIFDVAASAAGQAANTPEIIEKVELELQAEFSFEIKTTGKSSQTIRLPSKNKAWDYATLLGELQKIKQQYPQTTSITLSAGNDIEYLHVMHSMEQIKPIFPIISLGGFEK